MTAAPRFTERTGSPRIAAALSACAAALCVAMVLIFGWLALASVAGWPVAFDYWSVQNIYRPIFATIYVVLLSLPLTAVVGVFAAIAISDARIFGPAVTTVRTVISIMGSVPTVVTAFAAAIAVSELGKQPTHTIAAFALAFINMPLMTLLASNVISGGSQNLREVATALGATPAFVARRVFLPSAWRPLGAAALIVMTQIIGGASAIALVDSVTSPRGLGWAPIGAWPLAVDIWVHGTNQPRFAAAAAGALLLTVSIWLLQGIAQLRGAPSESGKDGRHEH